MNEWFWNGFWATIGYAAANLLLPIALLAIAFVGVLIAAYASILRDRWRRRRTAVRPDPKPAEPDGPVRPSPEPKS